MNKRQIEVEKQSIQDEKKILKSLENNYITALADIKRTIHKLQSDPLMQSKIYQIQYQKQLEKQISGCIKQLQTQNHTSISDYMKNSYTQGFVGAMYDMQGQGVPLVLPMNESQVIKAVSKIGDDFKLYDKLDVNTQKLKKQVQSELSRGLATNLSYSDIARNISNYGEADKNRSFLIVRTEGHRIQSAAKIDAMFAAKEKGADVVKQWDSTLDSNTRESHQALDGQIRELDEPFTYAGKSAMYPGGFGDASEDCNCRCVVLQRTRWAVESEDIYQKWNNETGGLIETTGYTDFKEKYLDRSQEQKNEFEKYQSILGKNSPKTLDDFIKLKYNSGSEWKQFKAYSKLIEKGELTPLADFELYKKASENIDAKIVGSTTVNGIKITGKSIHFIARVIGSVEQRRNGVDVQKSLEALQNPVEVYPIKELKNSNSQKFRSDECLITINPDTGNLIQVNPYKK